MIQALRSCFVWRPFCALAGCGLLALAGCGISSSPLSQGVQTRSAGLHGHIQGGQQPIVGSSVQLYAASLNGIASASVPLLQSPVTSDASGNFDITGDYTCPSSPTLVYLGVSGGNPGLPAGSTNPQITLMNVLGLCSNLSSATFISVNEVTTAAAVWALVPFMSSISNVGASSTNFAGLSVAFANAQMLADSATGLSPAASLPANVTVESSKLYALANVLAVCVNSGGGAACDALASATNTSSSDVIHYALAVVTHPAYNVRNIYELASPTPPFPAKLAAAPSDWTMSFTFTGGGLASPTALAINSTGQIWVGGYFGVLSGFMPNGTPIVSAGITGYGLNEIYGLTIDGNDNIWVTNQESDPSVNQAYGSISSFTSTGQPRSGANGFSQGGIYYPVYAAAAPNGSIWIADNGNSHTTLLAQNGTPLSGSTGYSNGLALPVAIAVDSDSSAWFSNQPNSTITHLGADGTLLAQVNCCSSPTGIALDPQGNLWIANFYSDSIAEVSHSGAVISTGYTGGGLHSPQAVITDSNGDVYISNYYTGSIAKLAGVANPAPPGSAISPGNGFGVDTKLVQPFGLAIDASGTLWSTSYGNSKLVGFIGLAAPSKTPVVGPPRLP